MYTLSKLHRASGTSEEIEDEKTKKTIFPPTTFNVQIKILCYVHTPRSARILTAVFGFSETKA